MKSKADGENLAEKIRSSVLEELESLLKTGELDDDRAEEIVLDLDIFFWDTLSRDEVIERLSMFMDKNPELFDALAVLDLDI